MRTLAHIVAVAMICISVPFIWAFEQYGRVVDLLLEYADGKSPEFRCPHCDKVIAE